MLMKKDFLNLKRSRWLLLTLFALLVGASPTWADELTVHDGTATSEYIPVYGYYADNGSANQEFIIPAADLSDMDGGTISGIKFYLSSPVNLGDAEYDVYLGEVNTTTLSALLGVESATKVYSGKVLDGTSEMSLSFSSNYVYNGGNLHISFYETNKGSYVHSYFYGETVTGAAFYSYPGYYGNTSSVVNFIPKTTFTYTPAAGVVSKPKAVTASDVTYQGATLSWTAGSDETEWEVAVNTTGETPAAEGSYTAVSTNPTTTISGLAAETTYYAFVRAQKGGNYSKWTSAVSFTTTERYPAPAGLAISNLTSTSATLTWGAAGQTSWEVAVNTTGTTPDAAGTVVNAATYDFSELTSETTYYAFVRVKDGENYSNWSAACEFTPSAYTYLTVNDGTTTNQYVPIYANGIWSSTKVASQFLILSTALTDMVNCELKKMTFYSSSESNNFGNGKFEVYLAEVNNTTVSSTKDWGEMTKVYNEATLSVSSGKMTIVFDNAFDYKGGNLLVGIKQTVKDQNGTNLNWYGAGTTSNMSRYVTGTENKKFSPKVTIGYQEKTGSELKVFDGETELAASPASFDFGLAAEGDTHTFTLKNTAATPYVATISSTNLTVSPTEVTPTAEGVTFTVTMPDNDITNEPVVITPAVGSGLEAFTINVSGTLRNLSKFYENGFNALPSGWSVDGSWSYTAANGATTSAWYINSGTIARLKTPMLTVAADEKFIVEAKGNYAGSQHVQLQYSTDGTNWTNLGDELELTSSFKTFTVTVPGEFVAGNYYIGLLASQASVRMFYGGEEVAGANFAINTDGSTQDFGTVKANATAEKTFTVTNNGNADLTVTLAAEEGFTAEGNTLLFTNNKGWSKVYVHAWNGEGDLTEWPGTEAAYYGKNTNNEDQYVVVVPDGATGILFNNGSGLQTPDITNFNVTGYYLTGNPYGENNKYIWADSWGTAPAVLTVAAGGSETFTVAMNTATPGSKSGNVTLSFDALNATSFTIPCTGFVKDPNALAVDFADGNFPEYWQVDAEWTVTSGAAVNSNTQTPSAIVTTPLTVAENETLTFRVKRNLSGKGYTKSLKVRYSWDGGVTWSAYQDYGDEFGSSFDDYQLTGVPAGTVIVEFLGNNIKLDDIEGFTKTTGPALALTEGSTAVANGDTKAFENLKAEGTATYTLKNIGNADMVSTVAVTGGATVALSGEGEGVTIADKTVTLAAGKSATITLTVPFESPYSDMSGAMTITTDGWIGNMTVNYTATLVDPTDFVEDFSGNTRPAGWYNGGWTFDGATASVALGTARNLITKKLEAAEGKNVLTFKAKYSNENLSKTLNVYTSADRKAWTLQKEVTLTADYADVTLDALADGNYYVKFKAANAIIDDVKGLKNVDLPAHDLFLASATLPTDDITPIDDYTATVNVASLIADETVAVELWMKKADEDAVKVAEKTNQSISNGETKAIEVAGHAPSAGTFDVYAKVVCAGVETIETDKVSVTVAETTELAITQFAPVAAAVEADEDNNFTAEFDVTVKNNGSTAIDVANIEINITNANDIKYDGVTKTNETVFLTPGEYANDNAKLFIYRWSTASDQEWGEFTKISDNLWSADLNGKTKFIVVRKPSDATSGFDGAWNQSVDLTAADGICFTFNGWDDKDGENHHNFTASNSALLPNNATAKMRFVLSTAAGNGGNFEFKAQESITDTWWTNGIESTVTVKVTAAPTLALTETDYRTFEEGNKYYEVTLDRPFIKGWNTLVLPFDFAASKISGATFYEFTANNNGELKFSKVTTETLTAGTPYLLNLDAAIDEQIVFNKVEITAATPSDVEQDDAHFIGTYRTNTSMVGNYGVTPAGTVQKGGEGSWMKAYRAYITMLNGQNARIAIFDETTGVSRILSAKEMNDLNMFNMQGQRVNNNAKGVIIKDGKKIVRK